MMHRHALAIAALFLCSVMDLLAQATFPTPVLTSLAPLGGKPGSKVEMQFKGADLDGAKTLLLSSLRSAYSRSLPLEAQAGKKGVLTVRLPEDLPHDLYDARLTGRYGVSNPRVFQVSNLAVVESPGTNVKAATALKVPLDSAIQGAFKGSVPHWFAFDAKKGQRVLAVFVGAAFNSRVSLVGTVMDGAGREVARMRDGLLDFAVQADGAFKLRVNDLMYGSGDEFGYRLSLTTGAVVWGVAGDMVYGWNLPGGKVVEGLKLSQGQPLERLQAEASLVSRLMADSPFHPYLLRKETESPEVQAGVTAVQVGEEFSAWFPAKGMARVFDLAFKAGDRFTIEVVSQQSGLPTDPILAIESVKKDAAGKETLTLQADVNDPAASLPAPGVRMMRLDPLYAYEAKADGLFRLSLSDPLNAANGRRYPYRLRISKAEDNRLDHAIALHPTLPPVAAVGPYEMASANVWREGMTALEVFVPGRTAQSAAAELTVSQVPAGVTCLGGFVGPGQSLGYIGFRASGDAPTGAAVLGGLKHTAFLSWAVKDTGREAMHTRIAGAPALGVVAEQAPVLIESATAGVQEVAADGKLELAFKAVRHGSFTDALKLKVLGLVDVAKAPELAIPAKANEGKLTLDVKALKLTPGEYGFILQGPAKMPFRREAAAVAGADTAAKKAAQAHSEAKQELEAAKAALKAIKPEDKPGLAAAQAKSDAAAKRLAQADQMKVTTEKAAKELAAKNPAKETTFIVYSNPIRIRVKEPAKK